MEKKNETIKTDFQKALSQVTEKETFSLASEFEVAVSTVKRWGTGIAVPHPRTQKTILEFLRRIRK